MTTAGITVYEDEGGEWRWSLELGNSKKFAVSGESFDSKGNAERAAARLGELLAHGSTSVTFREVSRAELEENARRER